MGHYTGPKARINRRLGMLIYETAGGARALDRRDHPPGMHTRGRRPSNYGLALMEKQKIKHYYGLGERQLRRYFGDVVHKKGNTGEQMLTLCERRLDNVVRRAGFTRTRPQARQGIAHGHFQVNGVKVTKPSYLLRAGDVCKPTTRNNHHGTKSRPPNRPFDRRNRMVQTGKYTCRIGKTTNQDRTKFAQTTS